MSQCSCGLSLSFPLSILALPPQPVAVLGACSEMGCLRIKLTWSALMDFPASTTLRNKFCDTIQAVVCFYDIRAKKPYLALRAYDPFLGIMPIASLLIGTVKKEVVGSGRQWFLPHSTGKRGLLSFVPEWPRNVAFVNHIIQPFDTNTYKTRIRTWTHSCNTFN